MTAQAWHGMHATQEGLRDFKLTQPIMGGINCSGRIWGPGAPVGVEGLATTVMAIRRYVMCYKPHCCPSPPSVRCSVYTHTHSVTPTSVMLSLRLTAERERSNCVLHNPVPPHPLNQSPNLFLLSPVVAVRCPSPWRRSLGIFSPGLTVSVLAFYITLGWGDDAVLTVA